MKNKDVILGLIILVLLIVTIIFGVRSGTNKAAAAEAEEMSAVLLDYLKSQDVPKLYRDDCSHLSAGRHAALMNCLLAVQADQDLTKYFEEDSFDNVDTRTLTPGYLVIENAIGDKSFDSEKFSLKYNNVEVATGCTTPGEIAPGFTCRFDFATSCQPGDNLEILYEGKRAYLKTC